MQSLKGITVVITRPEEQAQELMALVKQANGTPILFPALKIDDIADPRKLLEIIERLSQFDLAVFISANAVDKVLPRLKHSWPTQVKVAAMGPSTAKALKKYGIQDIIVPEHKFESETLLATPELNAVAKKKIVIFRAQSGRELLKETLVQRGAIVEYAECYRRMKPDGSPKRLLDLWHANGLTAVVITSSEALRNLFDLVGVAGQQQLKVVPVFVSHQRIAQSATRLGLQNVITTAPGDQGLFEGLLKYFEERAFVN